jgi:L-fuconolactonase
MRPGDAPRHMVVDAHQHFWDLDRFDYPWITPELQILRRPYGPQDLEPLLAESGVSRTVLVQATESTDETRALLQIAESTPFVAGVVGWLDLAGPDCAEAIAELRGGLGGGYLVGLRHDLREEPDPEWLLGTDVQRGFEAVGAAGLTFDYLLRARELPAALANARMHPDVRFVIDHIGKPAIARGEMGTWERSMEPLAELENVFCKLSGMITEAGGETWTPELFAPYVARVLEWFGPDRPMFGSDWPVCLLAGSYSQVVEVLDRALEGIPEDRRAKIYGANAERFYGLD